MKKRKAPILLVSLLVVLAAGGIGYTMYMNAPQRPDVPDQQTQPRDGPTASDVGNQVRDAVNMKPTPSANTPPIPTDGSPSIAINNGNQPVPKPQPHLSTSTSSQWYR